MKQESIHETRAGVLLHPVRLRILLALFRRQLTTQQLAQALTDVPPATLYRHLGKLVAADLIAVVAQRPVRGTLEKVYGVAEEGMSLSPTPALTAPEEWRQAFGTFTASLLGQFQLYLSLPGADPLADGVSFRSAPLYLSDSELTELNDALKAVILPALAQEPRPGRRQRILSTIVMPGFDPLATEENT